MRPWLDRIVQDTGPLALYDAHTHLGQNDPDGFKQTPAELLDGARRGRTRAASSSRCTSPRATARPTTRRSRRPPRTRTGSSRSAASARTTTRSPRRAARSTPARAASSSTRAPSSSGWTSRSSRELVALAHERRVPMLIHAGRGIPALGREHGAARGALPGRDADPRPRRDLRPRLAVAGAARPPQRARSTRRGGTPSTSSRCSRSRRRRRSCGRATRPTAARSRAS